MDRSIEISKQQLYLEYEIQQNRPGLLGAVSTIMGMLDFNIITVSSIGTNRRGFLLEVNSKEKISVLKSTLDQIEAVNLIAFRAPSSNDRIALKHGKRIEPTKTYPPVYHFSRDELGVLVDFLGDILLEGGNKFIGLRGMPRVGKTEAAIAACVYANKKWVMVSTTMLRQIVRNRLSEDEQFNSIFLVDGLTSTSRGCDAHWELLNSIFSLPVPKIVEHPDIFIRDGRLQISFDLIIEIRTHNEEIIKYEEIPYSFSSFDLS